MLSVDSPIPVNDVKIDPVFCVASFSSNNNVVVVVAVVGSVGDEEKECLPESLLPDQTRFFCANFASMDDALIASLSSSLLLPEVHTSELKKWNFCVSIFCE